MIDWEIWPKIWTFQLFNNWTPLFDLKLRTESKKSKVNEDLLIILTWSRNRIKALFSKFQSLTVRRIFRNGERVINMSPKLRKDVSRRYKTMWRTKLLLRKWRRLLSTFLQEMHFLTNQLTFKTRKANTKIISRSILSRILTKKFHFLS